MTKDVTNSKVKKTDPAEVVIPVPPAGHATGKFDLAAELAANVEKLVFAEESKNELKSDDGATKKEQNKASQFDDVVVDLEANGKLEVESEVSNASRNDVTSEISKKNSMILM